MPDEAARRPPKTGRRLGICDRAKQARHYVELASQVEVGQRSAMKAHARTAFARNGKHLTTQVEPLNVKRPAQVLEMAPGAAPNVKE
jgi:hypothetical protein